MAYRLPRKRAHHMREILPLSMAGDQVFVDFLDLSPNRRPCGQTSRFGKADNQAITLLPDAGRRQHATGWQDGRIEADLAHRRDPAAPDRISRGLYWLMCSVTGTPMYSWDAVRVLAALACQERFAVLGALVRAGEAGLTISHLAPRAGLSRRLARQHALALVEAGLVERLERQGAVAWRADADGLGALLGFLTRRLTPHHGRKSGQSGRQHPAGKSAKARSLTERLARIAPPEPQLAVVVPVAAGQSKPRKRRMPVKLSDAIAAADAA